MHPTAILPPTMTELVPAENLARFTKAAEAHGLVIVSSAPCTLLGQPAYAITVRKAD